MAKRKTAMASEPRKAPPTGGGLKAKPNVPLQRLSPGVYRGAGGGLVSKTGRSLEPKYPSGMAERLAGAMQPETKGPLPFPQGSQQQGIQEAFQVAPMSQAQQQFMRAGTTGPQGQIPQEMLQGLAQNKMGQFRPGLTMQDYMAAAQQQQPMQYRESFINPMLSGYRPPLAPAQQPLNPMWSQPQMPQGYESMRTRGR